MSLEWRARPGEKEAKNKSVSDDEMTGKKE